VAIGSSAVAVALNAAWGLVKWPCVLVFAAAGVTGAFVGASLGKQLGGTERLALFGLVMIGIGNMLTFKPKPTARDVKLTPETAAHLLPRLLLVGAGVGLLSGFFGIGGGFLIVPGLVLATGMALQNAIGTSLVAVTTFGLATATSYTSSGLVDWRLAVLVIAGGIAGSVIGTQVNVRLAGHKRALAVTFAGVVIAVGLYVVACGVAQLFATG
jgi:uncharacterized membrane protein YfcA